MANLTLGNKTVVTQAGSAEPVLASNVNLSSATFPAGHILQTQSGTFNTQTSIGTTAEAVITLTFNTKGTNSIFYAHANACVGAAGDIEGYFGGICLKEGSAVDFRSPMQIFLGTAYNADDGGTSNVGNALFGDDHGNHQNAAQIYEVVFPIFTAEKATTIAAGATITVALWFRGVNTLYINRSSARASHEGGITRLVVHEVQS